MHLIPAIDLMKGKIVRLTQGQAQTAKIYSHFGGPVLTAKKWVAEGARKLQIIDLDAALGIGNNFSVIEKIVKNVDIPIQIGGGIRKITAAKKLLKLGVRQVILGALAFNNPKVITKIQQEFGFATVIVALDNRSGKIMVEGWKTPTGIELTEALKRFEEFRVTTYLITSITKDGTLSGPDFENLSKACRYPNLNIIAAGGVGNLNDLVALKRIGVEGVVIGKALYEGKFSFREAVKIVGEE